MMNFQFLEHLFSVTPLSVAEKHLRQSLQSAAFFKKTLVTRIFDCS